MMKEMRKSPNEESSQDASQDKQNFPCSLGARTGDAPQVQQQVPQEVPVFETCEKCSLTKPASTSNLCSKCIKDSVASQLHIFKSRIEDERKVISEALEAALEQNSEHATKEIIRQKMAEEERKVMAKRQAEKEAERIATEAAERKVREEAELVEAERLAKEAQVEAEFKAKLEAKKQAREKASAERARKAAAQQEQAEIDALDDWVCPFGHAMETVHILDDWIPCEQCDKDGVAGEEFWTCRAVDKVGSYICS